MTATELLAEIERLETAATLDCCAVCSRTMSHSIHEVTGAPSDHPSAHSFARNDGPLNTLLCNSLNQFKSALRGVEAAREALRKAVQMAEICSDWNLDEIEIDGKMVRSHKLAAEFAALSKVTP